MSIYNEKHRPHYLNLHLFTPKRKKVDLKYFSRTGYSISSYGICGRTKTTDIYIDRMILCGCKSLIQKMIYLFKKNKKSQSIEIKNKEQEKTNNNQTEIKLNLDLSLLNATLPNDTTEKVYVGGQHNLKVETLSKPCEKKEKPPHISKF